MKADPFPYALEAELNRAGVYFKPVTMRHWILEDRRQTPPRYRGTNQFWRHDPATIRNFFNSKQEAYAALQDGEELDITLDAVVDPENIG